MRSNGGNHHRRGRKTTTNLHPSGAGIDHGWNTQGEKTRARLVGRRSGCRFVEKTISTTRATAEEGLSYFNGRNRGSHTVDRADARPVFTAADRADDERFHHPIRRHAIHLPKSSMPPTSSMTSVSHRYIPRNSLD